MTVACYVRGRTEERETQRAKIEAWIESAGLTVIHSYWYMDENVPGHNPFGDDDAEVEKHG